MYYIEKLDLQTEEIKEVETLEKHTIINNKPFTVDEYIGHTREFLAIEGEYDDGFNKLNETNGIGINCIVSRKVNNINSYLDSISINVLKHGVQSSSDIIQTDIINTILRDYKGHKIYFPDGNYIVDDSLLVYSNTKIELSKNAIIKFKENKLDVRPSVVNGYNGHHIIKNAEETGNENIEICGGLIDGSGYTQGLNTPSSYPNKDVHKGLYFKNVKGLKVHDIKIKEILGWGICYVNCENFDFYNIEFEQCSAEEKGYNGDGISGIGKNGRIYNISGYVSDDLVSTHSGETILDSTGECENISISNLRPMPLIRNGVKEECYRAFAIYSFNNALCNNIIIDNVQGNSLKSSRIYTDTTGGVIKNITLSNINNSVLSKKYNDNTCANLTIGQNGNGILEINNINMSNINFYNEGVNVKNAIKIYDNVNIESFNINNLYYRTLKNNPCIADNGNVKAFKINNIMYLGANDNDGYVYYKENTSNVKLYLNNISGNYIYKVGVSNDVGQVRELLFDKPTNRQFVYDNNEVFYNNNGLGIRYKDTNVFLNDVYNMEIGLMYLDSSKTMDKPYKIVTVTNSDLTLNIPKRCLYSGYMFILNVNPGHTNTQITVEGERIFDLVSFTEGVYLIARLGSSWGQTKLSNNRLSSN